MKLVTSNQMRKLDQAAISSGISGEILMQTAGEGLAGAIQHFADQHQLIDAPVLFIAGSGNNGGDAFVAARCLHEDDWPVECWLAAPEGKLKGDALSQFRDMKKAGVPVEILDQSDDWVHAAECGTTAEIIVDGLLGTGVSGAPRGTVSSAIDFINIQSDRALVIAIDVPSAMAVCADLTVTMGLPKIDCIQPENVDAVGYLEVVDIGIPTEFVDAVTGSSDTELIQPSDLAPLFPRRSRDTHKGDYGHVLCIGGSKGFSGAITMASKAALRSGAGLVSAFVPEAIHPLVASSIPEVMVHSVLPEARWTAILAGPGMGRTATTREQILQLLETSTVPLVLDADAVCALSDHLESIASATCPVILTPHPGEFAALFGLKAEEVQGDRFALARMAADRLGAIVVLKGAGTVVAAPDMPLAINLTGNPGMASGGSGDVLAGMLAGLAGQGMVPFEAACAAVWLHGHAGDVAAAEKAQACIIASDLIDKIPDAFRVVSCR